MSAGYVKALHPQHSTHHHTFSSHGGERVQLHTRTSNNPTQYVVQRQGSYQSFSAYCGPTEHTQAPAQPPNTSERHQKDLVKRQKRASPHLPPISSHWLEILLDLHHTPVCTQPNPCICPHRQIRATAHNRSCVTVSYCYHVQRNDPRRPLPSRFAFYRPFWDFHGTPPTSTTFVRF